MRTAGKMKAGFYPTPAEVVDLIADFIKRPLFHEGIRLLDPCAGEGEALRVLASRLGVKETYGVELDQTRAKQAGAVLKQVIPGSFESMKSAWRGFSLLFLNPPYDYDEESKRLEYKFLMKRSPDLQSGGRRVYWIVQKHLTQETARYLASHFEDIEVRRFPDPHFERFHQIVIFGVRREGAFRTPESERSLERIPRLSPDEIPMLRKPDYPPYELVSGSPNFAFYSETVHPEETLSEISTSGLYRDGRVTDILFPVSRPKIKPLMPLRKGHLAMLISAGFLNNALLEHKGRRLLIKGRCVKEQVKHEEVRDDSEVVIERDVIKTTIKGLFLDTGKLINIE
jgi:predicted RNA methylase